MDGGCAERSACAALVKEPYGSFESSQLAHTWKHAGEKKRRAAVNLRPAGSKWMRSGSPSVTLLELGDCRVNRQRAAGTPLRPDPIE